MIRDSFSTRANGKLLLTGEYFVLDGASALALPTQLGQRFRVTAMEGPAGRLDWESRDDDGRTWFRGMFQYSEPGGYQAEGDYDKTTARMIQLLNAAAELRPELKSAPAVKVGTRLEFPSNWGLGSSSTLISCFAEWIGADPYQLLKETFGGSGYDIACATADGPVIYSIEEETPVVHPIDLGWPFVDNLYFVYLEQKQDSREAISHYRERFRGDRRSSVEKINVLTDSIRSAGDLEEFRAGIEAHEALLSDALGMPSLKVRSFSDFDGSVKSLGAWGGDFVLAASRQAWHDVVAYFTDKGYPTVIAWKNLILERSEHNS